jgi:hypothetical protein
MDLSMDMLGGSERCAGYNDDSTSVIEDRLHLLSTRFLPVVSDQD